jgi:Protein of unknown function (DUF4236)
VVQYRKSEKVGPIRLTASKSGISASVGYGPFRVTRRADGRYQRTARLPGTGIRDTRVIGGQLKNSSPSAALLSRLRARSGVSSTACQSGMVTSLVAQSCSG